MMKILVIVAMGVVATACIDLWALLLRRAFNIRSLDYCMLGRWVLHMRHGTFVHDGIGKSAEQKHECATGWMAHYSIGVAFALTFVVLISDAWLMHPTLLPALGFGVATVLVPFLTMQPAFGLGIAASRTPNPNAARIKSLSTHAVFGVGLYLGGYAMRL